MQKQVNDLRTMLDERYATQTKAIDAAFIAQQTAMQTALTAAERAVQTASAAAEKAVLKAESAAEKRFEAVNEFRAQLADQQATFMPRELAETQIGELRRTLDRYAELFNRAQGQLTGGSDHRTEQRLDRGSLIAGLTVVISIIIASIAVIALVIHG